MECEHGDVVYHTDVHWLSGGKVLKRFFDFRHEIDISMTDTSKQLPDLRDPSWLWDSANLRHLTANLNELHLKLQGKNKIICHVYADISAFQARLQLFIQQTERQQLVHFPTCTALSGTV